MKSQPNLGPSPSCRAGGERAITRHRVPLPGEGEWGYYLVRGEEDSGATTMLDRDILS